jgi:hypothetical protein
MPNLYWGYSTCPSSRISVKNAPHFPLSKSRWPLQLKRLAYQFVFWVIHSVLFSEKNSSKMRWSCSLLIVDQGLLRPITQSAIPKTGEKIKLQARSSPTLDVHYRNSLSGDISPHWRCGTGYWFDKVVLVVVFIIKFNFWTIKNLLPTLRSLKWQGKLILCIWLIVVSIISAILVAINSSDCLV